MRHKGPPSEISRLLEPMARVLDQAWRRMHWWIATMVVLYAFSGITVVRSDEAAVILRWGRLVGSTPALQEHGPGLLFAFPRPMDRVVRVQVKHVYEVPVGMLAASGDDDEDSSGENTLNPLTEGYAVTGDHNIVQVSMVARYRVRNPAEWAFYGPKAEEILRVETTAAMVRSLGEMAIDRILAEGRKDLIATATRRAQEGLDAAHSGLELSSLELTAIAPPSPLAKDFDAVQSAYIGAETMKNSAQAFGERAIPDAQAKANAAVQSARSAADSELALARGSAQAFHALEQEYRTNRAVVRERLYRDAVEQALSTASQVRWIPPPVGKTYHGFRIEVSVPKAGTRSAAPSNATPRAATSPAPAPNPTPAQAPASPVPPKPVVPEPNPDEEAP